MNEAIAGQEAVIDTIEGKTPYRDTDLERNVVKAILAAMKQNDVRRLIVTSTLGAGNSRGQASFFLRTLLLLTFLGGSTKDKEAMEQAVEMGGVNFIIVRPAILNDHESPGTVRTFGLPHEWRARS